MSDLAAAEQVTAPTMSRLVRGLEAEGLVGLTVDTTDRRNRFVAVTFEGRKLLNSDRTRRVAKLARDLSELAPNALLALETAVVELERLSLPTSHPGRSQR
jgi:DNA-binding MarR family transcriptional regulator